MADELVESVEGDERRDFEHSRSLSRDSSLETLLQLVLHRLKLSTANIAELAQLLLRRHSCELFPDEQRSSSILGVHEEGEQRIRSNPCH